MQGQHADRSQVVSESWDQFNHRSSQCMAQLAEVSSKCHPRCRRDGCFLWSPAATVLHWQGSSFNSSALVQLTWTDIVGRCLIRRDEGGASQGKDSGRSKTATGRVCRGQPCFSRIIAPNSSVSSGDRRLPTSPRCWVKTVPEGCLKSVAKVPPSWLMSQDAVSSMMTEPGVRCTTHFGRVCVAQSLRPFRSLRRRRFIGATCPALLFGVSRRSPHNAGSPQTMTADGVP